MVSTQYTSSVPFVCKLLKRIHDTTRQILCSKSRKTCHGIEATFFALEHRQFYLSALVALGRDKRKYCVSLGKWIIDYSRKGLSSQFGKHLSYSMTSKYLTVSVVSIGRAINARCVVGDNLCGFAHQTEIKTQAFWFDYKLPRTGNEIILLSRNGLAFLNEQMRRTPYYSNIQCVVCTVYVCWTATIEGKKNDRRHIAWMKCHGMWAQRKVLESTIFSSLWHQISVKTYPTHEEKVKGRKIGTLSAHIVRRPEKCRL